MSSPSDRIHVLHVEDDADFGDMAATFLEREDDRLSVQSVTNAGQGLEALDETRVDCIVSDYEMPGQTGIEFLQVVRDVHPELPFILFTGKGSEEVASAAISAGVTDYLQKEAGISQFEVLANRIANAVEQVRAREIARESEERLQTIAANTTEILWMFSADWDDLLFVNDLYEAIWGRTVDELREDPRSFLEGVHPADRDIVRQAMAALSTGDAVDIEYRVNAEEGFGRWVWVQGEPVFDADGAVVKVVGFARDITDRKRREHVLRQTRDRFQSVFETVNDAVFILDLDSETIVDANPRAVDLLGYSRDELLSEVSISDIHPADREQYLAFLERVQQEAYGHRGDFQCVTKDGEAKTCEISVAPTAFDDNEYLIATVRDISDRKAHERRLERFASVVAHELRNPVSVIAGRLQLVRENDDDGDHLAAIAAALDRMEALITDLLALSRGESPETAFEPVDLSAAARESWGNVEAGDARLVTEVDRTIRGDEGRLQQLLENLFSNAVEHGGGVVTVTIGELDAGFFVEDDGVGIPEHERAQVFEMGYSTAAGGTGFGLAIVQEMVESLGWSIRLTEGSEGGARFEITGVAFQE
ncbi:MAG: PAS domain S-box protein [Halobacteriales archaeon]